MTQPTETKVSRAYDGGIIILGALLLIAVIVGAVYLLSVAINDAPVVSAIFGILFVLFCVGSVIGYAAQTRWAITQNANVHIQVANSLGQALAQYKSQQPQLPAPQPVMTTYMPPNRAPEIPAATSVPRLLANGRPVGVKLQTLTPTGEVLTCSPAGLEAALKILADGEQPTREAFKKRGIHSSIEIAGAVDWIAGQGQIVKSGQGAATRWADGVTPASAPALADEFRPYCPTLPYFISQSFVEEMTGAGQVGQQAGRGRGRK
jgi:hypothetical protein